MAGLDYQQLPAQQQDPSAILKSSQEEEYEHMRSQYDNEARALGQTPMSNNDFNQRMNQLNTKHAGFIKKFKFVSQQQTQQLEQISTLVQQGNINPDAGKEAAWRLVLPQETERAMFPTQGAQAQPFSMSQMRGAISDSILEFAEGAADTPGLEWGDPKKQVGSLMDQYLSWRELISYDNLNPVRQNQLDMQWDAAMRDGEDDKFEKWFADDKKRKPIAQVSAIRPAGRIGDAMKKRVMGSLHSTTSPIGMSVKKQKDSYGTRMPSAYSVPRHEQKPKEQPSAERLRRAGTQEAYNRGVKLGYWN